MLPHLAGRRFSNESFSNSPCTMSPIDSPVPTRGVRDLIVQDLVLRGGLQPEEDNHENEEIYDLLKHLASKVQQLSVQLNEERTQRIAEGERAQHQITQLRRDMEALAVTNNSPVTTPQRDRALLMNKGGAHESPVQRSETSRAHKLAMRIPSYLLIPAADVILERRVGQGSFGEVWKGRCRGVEVAVKQFKSREADFAAEIILMDRVRHYANVIDFQGVTIVQDDKFKEPQVAVITRFMEQGSMRDMITQGALQALSIVTRIGMMAQAAVGVRGLHLAGVIHRDLACRNLLVDDQNDVSVADFGFARLRKPQRGGRNGKIQEQFSANAVGPVKWEAPESLQRSEYSDASDAFSFGVCLYEAFVFKEPWVGLPVTNVSFKVMSGERMHVPPFVDPVVADIMLRCWDQNAARRPHFAEIAASLRDRKVALLAEKGAADEEKELLNQLRNGCRLLKLPFRGVGGTKTPRERTFRVSSNFRRLIWGGGNIVSTKWAAKKKVKTLFASVTAKNQGSSRGLQPDSIEESYILLQNVVAIQVGQQTTNFKSWKGFRSVSDQPSLSIVTGTRTVDIICPSAAILNMWVRGLTLLTGRLKPDHVPPLLVNKNLDLRGLQVQRWQLISCLRRGGYLLKYAHQGLPHERWFCVSENLRYLEWESQASGTSKTKQIDLRNVMFMLKPGINLFTHNKYPPEDSAPHTGEDMHNITHTNAHAAPTSAENTTKYDITISSSVYVRDHRGSPGHRLNEYVMKATNEVNEMDESLSLSLMGADSTPLLSVMFPSQPLLDMWHTGLLAILEYWQSEKQVTNGGKEFYGLDGPVSTSRRSSWTSSAAAHAANYAHANAPRGLLTAMTDSPTTTITSDRGLDDVNSGTLYIHRLPLAVCDDDHEGSDYEHAWCGAGLPPLPENAQNSDFILH